MKYDAAYAMALELDAQCLRIAGDAQGAANLQHKAEQIRAGTYQEPPPSDAIAALREAQDRLDALPLMHDCDTCGRIATLLKDGIYLCHRCGTR